MLNVLLIRVTFDIIYAWNKLFHALVITWAFYHDVWANTKKLIP